MTTVDFRAEMARVMSEVVQIEERIAELAFWLTDEDKRDRLSWIDEGGIVSYRPDATVFHPRSIACRWAA